MVTVKVGDIKDTGPDIKSIHYECALFIHSAEKQIYMYYLINFSFILGFQKNSIFSLWIKKLKNHILLYVSSNVIILVDR